MSGGGGCRTATDAGTEEKLQLGGEPRKSAEHNHHPFHPVLHPPPRGAWPAGSLGRGSQDGEAPGTVGLHPAPSLGSSSSLCASLFADLGGKQGQKQTCVGVIALGPLLSSELALAWSFVIRLRP